MQRLLSFAVLLIAISATTIGLVQASAGVDMKRGQTLAEQGDVAGAMAAYEKVVAARPEWPDGYASLGGMQLMDQRYGDAVLSFQKAISLGADSRRPFVGMGMAYIHMGQFGPARAAFVEAKARSSGEIDDIDKILNWLDAKQAQVPKTHP